MASISSVSSRADFAGLPRAVGAVAGQVLAPDALDKLGSGGVRMYHSPTYLHCVIRSMSTWPREVTRVARTLRAGAWQSPRLIQGLPKSGGGTLMTRGGGRLMRSLDYNDSIASYYDPERLKRRIAGYREDDDPFSAAGSRFVSSRRFFDAARWAEFN